jgi:hypothetical protein
MGLTCLKLPIIVLDMSFLYKRSARLVAYWAITAIGSSLLLVPVPFIIQHADNNWRIVYWFWLAFAMLSLIAVVFPKPSSPAVLPNMTAEFTPPTHMELIEYLIQLRLLGTLVSILTVPSWTKCPKIYPICATLRPLLFNHLPLRAL